MTVLLPSSRPPRLQARQVSQEKETLPGEASLPGKRLVSSQVDAQSGLEAAGV
jgi:hypothetical protein